MFELDGRWVASASDLMVGVGCEYQLLALRAEAAGLCEPIRRSEAELEDQAAALAAPHLARVVADLRGRGDGATVAVGAAAPAISTPVSSEVLAADEATRRVVAAGAPVVVGPVVVSGGWWASTDLLVSVEGGGGLEPADVTRARHAAVPALVRAALVDLLLHGEGPGGAARLHLWPDGGARTAVPAGEVLPAVRSWMPRVEALLGTPVEVPAWGTDELRWCGWCDHCRAAATAAGDVLLVAGVGVTQRSRLREVGIASAADLAQAAAAPEGFDPDRFDRMRRQASLQLQAMGGAGGLVEVLDPAALAALPAPNPGDVFFDFEGDPHLDTGVEGERGIEYLFGMLLHDASAPDGTVYRGWWAHDRAGEQAAFEAFVDWLTARRAHPGMGGAHVYHYGSYEISALSRMARRYGTRAEELRSLLADGVFVDLYPVVRRGVLVSQASYSIKKLEPFYMGELLRDGAVTDGAASIVAYARARTCRAEGDDVGAAGALEELRAYNEYDCRSTLGLYEWLRSLVAAEAAEAATEVAAEGGEAHEAAWPGLELVGAFPVGHEAPGTASVEPTLDDLLDAVADHPVREADPFWWRRPARPAELAAAAAEAANPGSPSRLVAREVAARVAGLRAPGAHRGGAARSPALQVLLRRPSLDVRVVGTPHDQIARLAAAGARAEDGYLAVQAPPGTDGDRLVVEATSSALAAGRDVVLVSPPGPEGTRLAAAAERRALEISRSSGGGRRRGTLHAGTARALSAVGRRPADGALVVVRHAQLVPLAEVVVTAALGSGLVVVGDLQQGEPTSRAVHRCGVDRSVLHHLAGTCRTLPPEQGVVLRHVGGRAPALVRPLSHLAYDGHLEPAAPASGTADPEAEPVGHVNPEVLAPGVHAVAVAHRGRRTASPEEAEAVVALARSLIGRRWSTNPAVPPLRATDLQVLAPFDSHVELLRAALVDAGLHEVVVGMIDDAAAVCAPDAVVSITAFASSNAGDSPGGASRLLRRSRIVAALASARHACVIVHSAEIAEVVPYRPGTLVELGAFVALLESARRDLGPVSPR